MGDAALSVVLKSEVVAEFVADLVASGRSRNEVIDTVARAVQNGLSPKSEERKQLKAFEAQHGSLFVQVEEALLAFCVD